MCYETASLEKGFWSFNYSVAECFALWITWGPHLSSSGPQLFLLCQHLSWGARQSKGRHKPKYSVFPLAHLWNVARCGVMLKPWAKMEMWIYLILSHLSSCALTTLVSNHRLCLVPVFPPWCYHFQNVFVFWCVLQRSYFRGYTYFSISH